MAANGGSDPPPNRWRAVGGLLCLVVVGVLAVIDAMSPDYVLELGPMALLLGTGSVLLGVEGITRFADRLRNGQ